jgi:copper(I)-binding protein
VHVKAQPAKPRRIGIRLVAVLAALTALTTSACAAGQKAQTADESPAIDGARGSVGTMQLHAVAIKTPSGMSYGVGASAEVELVIVNTGSTDDALVGVSSTVATSSAVYPSATVAASVLASTAAVATPSASGSATGSATASATASGSATASATGSSSAPPSLSSLPVGAGQRVPLGISDADKVLVLIGLTKALYPGTSVPITFTFSTAGSVTIDVPVQLTSSPTRSPLIVTGSASSE